MLLLPKINALTSIQVSLTLKCIIFLAISILTVTKVWRGARLKVVGIVGHFNIRTAITLNMYF